MGKKIELVIPKQNGISLNLKENNNIKLNLDVKKGGGNYNGLTNRPSINNTILEGNKTSKELNLQDYMSEITPQDIDNMLFG